MTDRDALLALADRVEACVEDAIKPTPIWGYTGVFEQPDHRIICLANGLKVISESLRALAGERG